MRNTTKSPGEKIVKDIKRATRKHYSSEEKNCILLVGLRGEGSIAELCSHEGISQGIYYKRPKDFMEAGKRWLGSLNYHPWLSAFLTGGVDHLKRVVSENVVEIEQGGLRHIQRSPKKLTMLIGARAKARVIGFRKC